MFYSICIFFLLIFKIYASIYYKLNFYILYMKNFSFNIQQMPKNFIKFIEQFLFYMLPFLSILLCSIKI